MNSVSARRYVLLSIFGLLVLEAYKGRLSTAEIGLSKRLWGVGVLAILLSLLADVAPTVAGPFAVLVLVGAATKGGDSLIQSNLGRLRGAPEAVTHSAPKPAPGK